jgi:hypothetical protein
VGKDSYSLDDC